MHNPQGLQDYVLGKYYRHSKYSSFQRQLNYFGFKKKLHGGKKGKLCPCSYVHEGLGAEPSSLFTLKRRLRASGGRAKKKYQAKGNSGGSVEDGTSGSVQTTSSSPDNGNVNKRVSMVSSAAASVSSTSSSVHNSQQGDSASLTKLGEVDTAPPVSNKAVIVKDSNHANFLTTLPYPAAAPQLANDATNSSSVNNNAAPSAPLPLIPNNNWAPQSTGGNETTMIAMPFQPHLQVGHLNCFHQQLLNNHAAANAAAANSTIQVPPSSAASNNAANKDFDTEITIARANEVAREAQKALERAYRKRKQEAADEDDVIAAATATAQQYQQVERQQVQVQPQHQQQQQQQQVPQQQQIILPPDYQKLIQQPVYAMMQNQQQMQTTSMDFSAASDTQAANNLPPSSSFDPSAQTIDYASLGKQLWSQINPQLLQGLNVQMGGFPPLPPPTQTAATGAPAMTTLPQTTVSNATNNNAAPFRAPVPPSNQQPRQSNGSSSPIMFDDLFSKLLSTTLPPPEELFDDESSAGQLSDFDAELQALG